MKDINAETEILAELFYLPSISVFAQLQSFNKIIFEVHDRFKKSTGRNRCKIIGANGPILLTIPLEGGRGVRKLMKDVRISYEEPWQRIHWGSIYSAYRKSSYFEFYDDKFRHYYEKRFEFLMDYNIELMETCLSILTIKSEIVKTDEQITIPSERILDVRGKIVNAETIIPYHQVFEEKHGFIVDVSIIDLIFTMGPESKEYLEKLKATN